MWLKYLLCRSVENKSNNRRALKAGSKYFDVVKRLALKGAIFA
jgi:hypothetical protein